MTLRRFSLRTIDSYNTLVHTYRKILDCYRPILVCCEDLGRYINKYYVQYKTTEIYIHVSQQAKQ